jgi:hypothetical protein
LIGVGLVVWTLGRAGGEGAGAGLPPQLTTALIFTGGLEAALGAGLWLRSRVAWSFALSLDGVLAVVGFFALPAIAHAGPNAVMGGLALAVVCGTIGVLVAAKDEF